MIIHTQLQQKDPQIIAHKCQIVAAHELDGEAFSAFQKHLLEDYDFIREIADELGNFNGVARCLMVWSPAASYGVLVNSEGYFYARYSSVVPNAKTLLDAQVKELADYCLFESQNNSEDGTWSISYDELYEHFGIPVTQTNGIGKLLVSSLQSRPEVEELTPDEYDIEIKLCVLKPAELERESEQDVTLQTLASYRLEGMRLVADGSTLITPRIPSLSSDTLSVEGKEAFADVLSAKLESITTHPAGTIITLSGVESDRLAAFADLLRGQCTLDDLYRYTNPSPGEERIPKRAMSQSDLEIALAEHTLWLLDHPKGERAVFENCDLYRLDLRGKNFNNAVFSNCRIRDCRLHNAQFCFASFCGSDVQNSHFDFAVMENSDWADASVSGGSFSRVQMSGSNLTSAKLTEVDVHDTVMKDCCLADTVITDTNMDDAYTDGCVYSRDEWDYDTQTKLDDAGGISY